jgi:DNA mismatch repair protein MutS2
MAPAPRFSRDREIDLHAMYGDEAILRLSEEINRCLQYGDEYLRINHGKGGGILRTRVRETLAAHPNVARHFPASPDQGGDGVTIAQLRV